MPHRFADVASGVFSAGERVVPDDERVVQADPVGVEPIFGPEPALAQATRAVMALGGIQDCTVQFPDAPADELRATTIAAAMAALS
jgi:hypothetical protein